jgi:hypothetical protein
LAFSFLQNKTGATLSFDIQSNNATAKQGLNDCRFSVYAGEGLTDTAVNFKLVGTIPTGVATRAVSLKGFSQRLLATKTRKKKISKLFLRAGAVCPAQGVNVSSPAVQIKAVSQRTALASKRWLAKLGGYFKGS